MQRTGRRCVRELSDDVANPKPDYLAGGVASCPELIGMTSAFLPGFVTVAFEHQVRDAPDVDLWYHAGKAIRRIALCRILKLRDARLWWRQITA